MRGVVTLAAAQTLPEDVPQRDLLVFIAFLVAAGSLLVQGLTLGTVTRWLGLTGGPGEVSPEEVRELTERLQAAAQEAVEAQQVLGLDSAPLPREAYELPRLTSFVTTPGPAGGDPGSLEFELAVVALMRENLRSISKSGEFSSSATDYVLDELDTYGASVRMRLKNLG